MKELFFSIVVPAHNEANYIENTLGHLKSLGYPAEMFEVIVIENGSSDDTFNLAKKFEGRNFYVLRSDKGVSRARNAGIDRLSSQSDWVIFLDADTLLEKDFLRELNAFLQKPNNFSVGTVSLRPLPETSYARAWFWIHNVGHKLSRTSFSILIAKRSIFPPLRFNEHMTAGEDIDLIRQAQKHGKFFFLWTQRVSTSTRRFDTVGYWRLTFEWTVVGALPKWLQRRFSYEVVR